MIILEDYPELMTVKQMQTALGIGKSLAYALVKNGEIKSVRVRSQHRIPKSSIINYLNNNVQFSIEECYNMHSDMPELKHEG